MSVTEFITDGKKNILPGNGLIKGDARAFSEETNKMIQENMRQLVGGICDATPVQMNQILTEASLAFGKQKRIYLLLPSTNQSLQEIQQKYPMYPKKCRLIGHCL